MAGQGFARITPHELFAPENYRALVSLLHDRTTAAHLHHCRAITEPIIVGLRRSLLPYGDLPSLKLFDDIEGMDRLCRRPAISK